MRWRDYSLVGSCTSVGEDDAITEIIPTAILRQLGGSILFQHLPTRGRRESPCEHMPTMTRGGKLWVVRHHHAWHHRTHTFFMFPRLLIET